MDVRHTHDIYLCYEFPYVFIHGFAIIPVKLSEIRHPKSTWVGVSIIILRVSCLIGSSTPLGSKTEQS
jgi:hypothetical protein